MYPKSFNNVKEFFEGLPGVGKKNAERFTYSLLDKDQDVLEQIAKDITDLKKNTKYCKKCHIMTDKELCNICQDDERDSKTICVVNSTKDAFAIEKLDQYKGVYHILNGEISPNKGVLPKDLYIDDLLAKSQCDVTEIILATNPTIDGEMTALYISKLLEETEIKITRLAHGLPMGAYVDYTDDLTLLKALNGRQKIN